MDATMTGPLPETVLRQQLVETLAQATLSAAQGHIHTTADCLRQAKGLIEILGDVGRTTYGTSSSED